MDARNTVVMSSLDAEHLRRLKAELELATMKAAQARREFELAAVRVASAHQIAGRFDVDLDAGTLIAWSNDNADPKP